MLSACPRETYPVGQKGAAGGGGGWRPATDLAAVEDSRGEPGGRRQTLVSWVPLPAAAEAVGVSASCLFEVWAARLWAAPAIGHGLVGARAPGPQNRLPRGSRARRSSRGPGEGLLDELAEAQWSRLAPMQAA